MLSRSAHAIWPTGAHASFRVERLGTGDFARYYGTRTWGVASHFVWVNRFNESLTLELKQPDAMAELNELLVRLDVLVKNNALGTARCMSLRYEVLCAANPRLTFYDISEYGKECTHNEKKA